jgi:glycosyltransferase 2 family protein
MVAQIMLNPMKMRQPMMHSRSIPSRPWTQRVGTLLRWGITLLTGGFLGKTAIAHSHELHHLQFQAGGMLYLSLGIILLLIAEAFAGLIWHWILEEFQASIPTAWTIETFFQTTLAKYLPGNIWHLVGRIHAAKKFGAPLATVTLSVLIEPLFMIAGGLVVALLALHYPLWQTLSLMGVLAALHPKGMVRILAMIQRWRGEPVTTVECQCYPWRPLLGGIAFMTLRGSAFLCVLASLVALPVSAIPTCLSGFSLAWLLSIVLPSPGGIGVFESAAIQVLDGQVQAGYLLSAVVLYRLMCILAEVLGVLGFKGWHSLQALQIPRQFRQGEGNALRQWRRYALGLSNAE